MPERSTEVLATFTDKYGDEREIRRIRRNRIRIVRNSVTVSLALNDAVVRYACSKIKEHRKARGMSLAELARKSGVAASGTGALKQRMYEIENCLSGGIRLGTIYAIAVALELPVSDFLPTTDEALEAANIIEQATMAVG